MKAIRYTLGIILACLTWGSCQKVEEPLDTVPTVVTNEVEITSNYVFLTGSVSSRAECYFLISTSEDMADAERQYAEIDYSAGEEPADWLYYCGLGKLMPGTTYYAALCATDGRSEVCGNVVSFTTLEQPYLNTVTYTPWGENTPVDFVHDIALGGFLFYENLQGNLWQENLMISYDFNNNNWTLPSLDFGQSDIAMIAYWPYQQNASPWEFAIYNGTDYMYGICEGLNSSKPAIDIHLKHVMAKISFDIALGGNNTIEGTINTVIVGNHNDPANPSYRAEAIPWEGRLNMTTHTLIPIYNSHDGVWNKVSITPSTEPQRVETFIVPTKFGADMAYVELQFDNGYLLSWTFPETDWESGYEYIYSLTITENGLIVDDVIVEEWNDNDEGTITIN